MRRLRRLIIKNSGSREVLSFDLRHLRNRWIAHMGNRQRELNHGNTIQRHPLWNPKSFEAAWFYRYRGDHARARDWREHGNLQCRQRRAVARLALSTAGAVGRPGGKDAGRTADGCVVSELPGLACTDAIIHRNGRLSRRTLQSDGRLPAGAVARPDGHLQFLSPAGRATATRPN